jgi:3-keto-disaccharide hydrolase
MPYVDRKNKTDKPIVLSWMVLTIGMAGLIAFMFGAPPVARAGDSDSSDGWISLFDGRDLTGWDGAPRLWSVKDGVIRGQTTLTKPARGNTFLIWRGGTLRDFELKIKFRIHNGNSGIQYRSKEVGKWVVSGYQAEVENSPGKVGFLYHEKGRGWLVNVGDFVVIDKNGNKNVVGNVSDKNELIKAGYYKEKDWNQYLIVARGNHLMQYLNGYPTMELVDNDRLTNPNDPKDRKGAAREGILALQIHAGLPMLVEFKDILLKKLEPKYGDAVVLFNGRDLDNWQFHGDRQKSKWVVGKARISPKDPTQLVAEKGYGEMINLPAKHGDSLDIFSKQKFGDCRIEVQLMVPQGSNSGVYVMGEYEVQVLDSWGREKMGPGDMGAIYGASPPRVNACRRPGEWQKYVIEWQAPRFDAAGNKTQNAKFLKVELNGQVLHENLEMKQQTPGGVLGREVPTGPLMFQGNHGPVAFRDVVVTPLVKAP